MVTRAGLAPLEKQIDRARTLWLAQQVKRPGDSRSNALVHLLGEALDLGQSFIEVAESDRKCSLYVLERSIYERVVWAAWAALSEQNSEVFANAPHNELQRALKQALKMGHGKAIHRQDGADWSLEILRKLEARSSFERPRLRKMADDVGLGRIHTQTYAFLSMYTHGSTLGLPDDPMEPSWMLSMIVSDMKCISLISENWLIRCRATTGQELRSVLAGR